MSLPTGYGKTAVMIAACFMLKAARVLIVTPTNPLRSQSARAFREVEPLRRLGVLCNEEELQGPRVAVVDERIASVQQWRSLEEYDVAVCTPHSASPELEGTPAPPEDLFDVVLVDEGHHSAARTWAAFIRCTPAARHILFSATPFRLDRRQLPGRLIFYYTLRKAAEENAFGKVTFRAVQVEEPALENARDTALIHEAVAIYRRDAESHFEHRILARTDRVANGERLAQMYTEAGLRVEAVSNRRTKRQIEDIERRLMAGELDGVVCVDMFGEGYDFPRFKIAVLHTAHRSLVPTLQFIGRFARTNDERTGGATFIAVPRDVDEESHELYREGVDWDVLLADVAEARHDLAIREREMLRTFSNAAHPSADYENVNPGSFRLGQHIAAYKAFQEPNFGAAPEILKTLQVTNAWFSDDETTYLLLVKSVRAPPWYRDEHLIDATHECFLIKHFPESNLVFITATERSSRYYAELIEFFFDGNARSLAFETIRKVLNGMTEQEFYNIGIRSTSPTATTESYRISAGSSVDKGVRATDAANFAQGHFMGRGQVNGESEVIGASAGGRVWSNGKLSVPQILDWMRALHARITANEVNIGRSGLDLLPFGETLDRIPADTCLADWPKEAYRDNPQVLFMTDPAVQTCILDLEVSDIQVTHDGSVLTFRIGDDVQHRRLQYRLSRSPQYRSIDDDVPSMQVAAAEDRWISIEEWLEDNSLVFFTRNLESFSHGTLQRRHGRTALRPESLVALEWGACEIGIEFDIENPERPTVQNAIRDQLLAAADIEFIVYDHRSGEAADFVVGTRLPGEHLLISLYHCKAAGGRVSGDRVEDVYELAGQAVKSARFQRKDELVRHLERRTLARRGRGHSPFLKGDRDTALELVRQHDPIAIGLAVYAVQPGLSARAIAESVQAIMAAANDSLTAQRVELRWMVSA